MRTPVDRVHRASIQPYPSVCESLACRSCRPAYCRIVTTGIPPPRDTSPHGARAQTDSLVLPDVLSSRINAARCAIDDSGEDQRLVCTIGRKGIRFVGSVREEPGAEAATATERPKGGLGLPDRPSIAVLPFVNMSGDPEQEYFADGMVEDLITGLSRVKWLFVIARNSSFAYKGRAVDVKQVGRELGVRYVLEGSVRKVASRVRISGQLVEAE